MVTNENALVVERHDYMPFGEEIINGFAGRGTLWGMTTGVANQKFTGKERDSESGLDYFGARYYGSALGRFTSPDPTFLNVLRVVNPQRWNRYAYALGNPLRYVDPDGEEAISITYPGYQVGVRGDFSLLLGHAGVVVVAKDGSTHYFEYGRYNGPNGMMRNAGKDNISTPDVQRDASGNITADSMKALLSVLSTASGKGGEVDALVYRDTDSQDAMLLSYLEERQRENDNPNRSKYSISHGHNCGTLICEAFDFAGKPSPSTRSMATPAGIFSQLLMLGWNQEFSYTPKKEKVSSKICYATDNGQVCQ
jgi:RHS repeat-associated protein